MPTISPITSLIHTPDLLQPTTISTNFVPLLYQPLPFDDILAPFSHHLRTHANYALFPDACATSPCHTPRMPREIIHPTPFWQKGFTHAEWAHVRTGYNSGRHVFPAIAGFSLFLTSVYAYAERRCLFVYQKHDPRSVYLPWEQAFIKKYEH